jgi:MSHA biogenesis protein MshP
MFLNLQSSTNRKAHQSFSKQRGISMAFLLFAIIIVSLLAAALIRINSQSELSVAQQVISTRAFFAAESGANLQALAVFPVGGGAGACSNQNYNFTNNGLNGCSASTQCSAILIDTSTFYQIISQGQCNSGQPLQATRTIEVRLKDADTP